MAPLAEVSTQVQTQNAGVATQQAQAALDAKFPPAQGDKNAPPAAGAKPGAQMTVEEMAAAYKAAQASGTAAEETPGEAAPDAKKEARKAKLSGLRTLADQTQMAFVEGQRARQVREQATAEVTKLREEADKASKELAQAIKDPLGWLESKGVKMRALAERVAKGDDPTGALKAMAEKIAELETKNEQAKLELSQREERARQQAHYHEEKQRFLKTYDDGKAVYPTLHAIFETPEELIQEFLVMTDSIKKDPKLGPFLAEYSNAELLEALEAKMSARYARLKPGGSTVSAQAGETSKQPKPTLTSRGASETAAVPVDFKKLSPKEQVKSMTELYKRLKKV